MNYTYGVSLKENRFNYLVILFRNFVSRMAKNAAEIDNGLFHILFDKTALPKYLMKTKKGGISWLEYTD